MTHENCMLSFKTDKGVGGVKMWPVGFHAALSCQRQDVKTQRSGDLMNEPELGGNYTSQTYPAILRLWIMSCDSDGSQLLNLGLIGIVSGSVVTCHNIFSLTLMSENIHLSVSASLG